MVRCVNIFKVPKSFLESYNGAELRLNISYKQLETDEVKDDDKGMLESITESVKDKTKSLKEKLG
jgi:hypothetical protein